MLSEIPLPLEAFAALVTLEHRRVLTLFLQKFRTTSFSSAVIDLLTKRKKVRDGPRVLSTRGI